MKRLTMWWRNRQQARVSSDQNDFSRSGMRFLVVFFAILFLVAIIWSAMLGGRWVYRKTRGGNGQIQKTSTGQQSDERESGADDKKAPAEWVPKGADETPKPDTSTTQSPTPKTVPTTPQVPCTGPSDE